MANVSVTVKMSPDYERIMQTMPQTKEALDKRAIEIAGQANALGSSFKTGTY